MERGMRDQMMGGGPRGGGGGHGDWKAGLSGGFGWWFGLCLTFTAISLVTLTVFAVLGWFRKRGGEGTGDEGDPDARAALDQRRPPARSARMTAPAVWRRCERVRRRVRLPPDARGRE